MSAGALSMHDWIDTFSVSVQLEEIHPSAQCICHESFNEMHMAVEAGDMSEFARLLRLTQDKFADESFWEEEKQRSAADPNYVVSYFRD
jgi:hypothetical protein